MTTILSDLLIFLTSTVKFMLGSLTAITADLGIFGSLSNLFGGIVGVLVFTYLEGSIRDLLLRTFPNRFNKKFTKSNRNLVRIKQRFGLIPIALITPILLSIPIGVFTCLALTTNKTKVVLLLMASLFFWYSVLFIPYFAFGIDVMGTLKRLF